ncbi:disease resistance protein At4g27190 isoform X2 [Manihot esculenta]|uniref:disease resistance protein At4g27190 isoform X2 n=1 Tax=Manihot esculenta TaxID=3983 RepID=UPI001CC5AA23|nr:disease resistance protein At4g27190 isoform X2 [Manihot esculenta]
MEVLLAIGGTIAGEIAKNLVAPIWRPFYYLIYYKHNIENLKEELQKLDDKRTEVGLRVNNAKSNLQVVVDSVIRWQEKADGIDRRSREFIQNEMNVNKCLNRYSLSRKAKKMTENMLALLEEARNFGEIAYPDPCQKIELWFSDERIKNFKSRESILHDILMALKNDDLRVIGICGMSGIGKTTMVKQLMKNMETKKLFDEFAMVAVSDTPDFRKIQDEIASCLGLELKNDESEVVRASKLHQRLTNCDKRILLILDDVWKEDGLGEIGVPLGCRSNGCKIVLTSRNEFVCSSLGSQRNFLMKVLNDEEALVLFKETADDSIGHDLLDTVKEIVNECEGLPIAIVTLSKALKNKNKHIWNDVLRHLKNSKLEDISGMKAKVFSAIELSYNYLEDEEAQSCFLLCSLFPEDFNILVEDLLEFGMGLRLFKGVEYVHEGRDRIYKLIDMLKGSNLLLEGDDIWNESVKMHDLVRDVAISLASTNKQWHTLQSQARINEWQGKDWYKNCTAISLLCEDIKKLKDHLKCPNLELLQLWHDCQNDCQLQSLPINVLEGMKGLKVLSIASRIPSLPQSIDVLKNLQTLCLWNDRLNEMHTIGDLVKLEILEVRSYRLEELPAEIGNLKNLRLLNLRRVENLRYIPPDVLVGLSKLEELYLPLRYMMKWEWKEDEEKTNASLSELGTHHITALHITVVNAYISPKASVFRNLIRFHIFVGKSKVHIVHKDSENVLHLKGDASDIKGSGICVLLRKVEVLYLEEVKNLKKIVNEIEDNSFADLKRDECVDALVRIPESPKSPLSCLSNLRKVEIYECDELKYFIPLSMARELRQLHSMTVMSCEKMEGIFYRNKVNDEIESPLTTLCLNNLPNFIGFIYKDIEESSASEINNRMEIVQSKTEPVEKISIFFSSLWLRLSKLQKLTLRNCGLVKALFHPSVTQQFLQLKELNISACCKMEYIVAEAKEEEKNKGISKIAFPNLTKLDLGDLPELVAFFADNDISFELYSLVCLDIWSCPKLKTHYCETPDSSTLNKSYDQRLLRRGKPKDVSKKKDMEMEQPSTSQMKSGPMEMISTLFFPPSSPLLNLRELHIFGCDFQEAAFPLSVAQQLEQLKDLTISSCEKMEYIVAKDKGRSKIVLFPSLTDLDLSHLPNLMGFCKDNNVSLEWSLLERLWFYEIVPSKIVSVPKSSTLSTNDEVDHLDTTFCATLIPRRRKKQDNNFSKKVSLIKNQRDPSVSNTDESCAFPSKLIQQLQNLKHLRIHGSDSVEVIFSFEGLINGVLNSVEEICLVNLPNLKHVWFKIPPEVTAFQNLRELIVIDCDNLINLFSICSAKLVGNLQSIEIRRCNRMEEIIGKEDEEISTQKIVFPQLRSLTLEDLPNLNSFCNRIYALEFPFLETLKFLNWKRMETFFYGSLSMPKLEKVMINRRLHQLMGSDPNLNAKMSELLKMNQ